MTSCHRRDQLFQHVNTYTNEITKREERREKKERRKEGRKEGRERRKEESSYLVQPCCTAPGCIMHVVYLL